jgi:putative ABC transport system substrate-binding protein
MRRRNFLGMLGGVAAWWPLDARGQQPAAPMIGFIHSRLPLSGTSPLVTAFRRGLKEMGFVDGYNVTILVRSAEGQPDRLRAYVSEMIQQSVAVIAGNTLAMLAAKAGTKTIPIVFAGGTDPVKLGLVDSLGRPGGNVTGAAFFAGSLGAKRLELLRQLVPTANVIAMFVNPNSVETEAERNAVLVAARSLNQKLIVLDVIGVGDIDSAFAKAVERGASALYVGAGPFFLGQRRRLADIAAHYHLPASYAQSEYVSVGGLTSYGTSITGAYHQAGIYAGRILKGEKPADLPVQQSTKFELAINLRTAKALGITVPQTLLVAADELVE